MYYTLKRDIDRAADAMGGGFFLKSLGDRGHVNVWKVTEDEYNAAVARCAELDRFLRDSTPTDLDAPNATTDLRECPDLDAVESAAEEQTRVAYSVGDDDALGIARKLAAAVEAERSNRARRAMAEEQERADRYNQCLSAAEGIVANLKLMERTVMPTRELPLGKAETLTAEGIARMDGYQITARMRNEGDAERGDAERARAMEPLATVLSRIDDESAREFVKMADATRRNADRNARTHRGNLKLLKAEQERRAAEEAERNRPVEEQLAELRAAVEKLSQQG